MALSHDIMLLEWRRATPVSFSSAMKMDPECDLPAAPGSFHDEGDAERKSPHRSPPRMKAGRMPSGRGGPSSPTYHWPGACCFALKPSHVCCCDSDDIAGFECECHERQVVSDELFLADVRALSLHYLLPLLPEPFDAERDHVASFQEHIRLLAETDTRRRPGRDNVARVQAHELRQV